MESRLCLREHEERELHPERGSLVVNAIQRLATTLKPRVTQVSRNGDAVEVKNFVGSVRMSDGTILEVEPKVAVNGQWPQAVVQLLRGDSRISVTGSQRSRPSTAQSDLTAVIAFEYARRLEAALSKDGPLQVFEQQNHSSRRPNGQLDISMYARTAWLDPVLFPIRREELTVANDFSRGLSLVAHAFRRSVADLMLSARLRRLESAVIPGHPLPAYLNPSVASRPMPAQWSAYRPAWDIAAAVLRNRALINDPGHSVGLEVAVEPWPLLESLLDRCLDQVERSSSMYTSVPKRRYPILKSGNYVAGEVEPDGVLRNSSGNVVATFEAKYTRPGPNPSEAHRYQALSAAAVLHAPVAVLIYPGKEAPRVYDVQGFNRQPARLATIGLDMYGYERDFGAAKRADVILRLISAATSRLS